MLSEAKTQVLKELETNKKYHLAAARNEHRWALGSDSMETSIMHEDNRVKQIVMAEFYDKLIKFLEEN